MGHYGLAPILFESVSAVTATPSTELGARVHADGKDYVYVYNAGNSQAIPGNGVTVSGVSGYSVTISSTTMADAYVGVVHHATLTTGTYGWVVARGFSKVKAVANTALAAGNMLVAGGDGLFTPAIGTQTAPIQGKCSVATASAGVGEAYVNCLFG
jgi:hypothetical protein